MIFSTTGCLCTSDGRNRAIVIAEELLPRFKSQALVSGHISPISPQTTEFGPRRPCWHCIFAEAHPRIIFTPKFLFVLLRAFQESLSRRASEHNPGTSKHRGNQGGESAWIFNFVARIRARIFHFDGAFFPGFWCGLFVDFFSPIFPVPKNQRKIHANFENIFPTSFSGCSALVYVAAIGCPYFHVDKPRLASLTFQARNFQ